MEVQKNPFVDIDTLESPAKINLYRAARYAARYIAFDEKPILEPYAVLAYPDRNNLHTELRHEIAASLNDDSVEWFIDEDAMRFRLACQAIRIWLQTGELTASGRALGQPKTDSPRTQRIIFNYEWGTNIEKVIPSEI